MANAPSNHSRDQRIVACIPYYECRRYIRRAVASLLSQTHRNITVVVVNDGDPKTPWLELADIHDSRLVRFDLAANHGPYFASAVVLNATSAPYFLVQDADDWSTPTRAANLLEHLERDGADLAVSAQPQYIENEKRVIEVRWAALSREAVPRKRFTVSRTLGPEYAYRAPHHGLFRSDTLRRVGGYYAGFRIGYDTILTNFILMTGTLSHVAQPLYYRQVRPDSLTHSQLTGHGSAFARRAQSDIVAMYNNCFHWYAEFLAGRIDSTRLANAIRVTAAGNVSAANAQQLTIESQRLRRKLLDCGIESGRAAVGA